LLVVEGVLLLILLHSTLEVMDDLQHLVPIVVMELVLVVLMEMVVLDLALVGVAVEVVLLGMELQLLRQVVLDIVVWVFLLPMVELEETLQRLL
jgi:hypothetical protein